MKLDEVRSKAAELGIDAGKKRKKSELILLIQEAEGYMTCFGQNDKSCPYTDCCFWDDCIKEYKKSTKGKKPKPKTKTRTRSKKKK